MNSKSSESFNLNSNSSDYIKMLSNYRRQSVRPDLQKGDVHERIYKCEKIMEQGLKETLKETLKNIKRVSRLEEEVKFQNEKINELEKQLKFVLSKINN